MRLVCPNCAAQYEVEDSVIPDNGRDVQCSNCGHTWYQRSASRPITRPISKTPELEQPAADHHHSTDDATEDATVEEVAAVSEEPAEREEPEQETEAAEMAAAGSDAAVETAEAVEEEHDHAALEAEAPRALDPEVTDILREEAEREHAERDAETRAGLETQSDMGLDSSSEETPPHIQERMARLREMEDELGPTALATTPTSGNRKELLPDIEEINSTLSPSEEEGAGNVAAAAKLEASRGGFRRGFALVIIIFAAMMLAYIYAPNIVQLNPQTEPIMSSYVSWINDIRSGADGFMARTAERLTTLLDSFGTNG